MSQPIPEFSIYFTSLIEPKDEFDLVVYLFIYRIHVTVVMVIFLVLFYYFFCCVLFPI